MANIKGLSGEKSLMKSMELLAKLIAYFYNNNYKLRKGIKLLIVLLTTYSVCLGQKMNLSDHRIFKSGNTQQTNIVKMVEDRFGNVIAIGEMSGILDLQKGPNIHITEGYGSFIAKFDSSRNVIWSIPINGNVIINDVDVNSNGDIAITGGFGGKMFIDEPSKATLYSPLKSSIFFAKFSANGDHLWSHAITWLVGGSRIRFDQNSNVIIAGTFSVKIDFDPSSKVFELEPVGQSDTYIACYDSMGNFCKAEKFGSTGSDYLGDIQIGSDNNLFVSGFYEGNFNFKGINKNNDFSGQRKSVLMKLNDSLKVVWGHTFTGSFSYPLFNSIAINSENLIYAAGDFQSLTDFDPSTGKSELNSVGRRDAFVALYDSSGDFKNVTAFGGKETETINEIQLGKGNSFYVTGNFNGTVDFDPGPTKVERIAIKQTYFSAKFQSIDSFEWVDNISSIYESNGNSILYSKSGKIWTVGYYNEEATFGSKNPIKLETNLTTGFFNILDSTGQHNEVWTPHHTFSTLGFLDFEIDSNGDIVLLGEYSGTVGLNENNMFDTLNSSKTTNVIILKLDSNLNYKWLINIRTNQGSNVEDLVIDEDNNIYITGSYFGTIDLKLSDGRDLYHTNGNHDIFLAKYNQNGEHVWSNSFGTIAEERATCIAINNKSEELIIAGYYRDSIAIGSKNNTRRFTADAFSDLFIASFKMSDGALSFAKSAGGDRFDEANKVICDNQGNILLGGTYSSNTIHFHKSTEGKLTKTTSGGRNFFLTLYDINGKFRWARNIESNTSYGRITGMNSINNTFAFSLIYDNNLYITDSTSNYSFTSFGRDDGLMGIINNRNEVKNVVGLGGTGTEWLRGIGKQNDVFYVIGNFQNELMFSDTRIQQKYARTVKDTSEIFYVAFDYKGRHVGTKRFPINGQGLRIDFNGRKMYLIGSLSHRGSSIGWVDDKKYYSSIGGSLIASYNYKKPCQLTVDSHFVQACDNYVDEYGNVYEENIKFLDSVKTHCACDSVNYFDVNINTIDTSVFINNFTIESKAVDARFQWLNCDSGFTILKNDTISKYKASKSGSYALKITKNTCIDTTRCINITIVSQSDVDKNNLLALYPNPTKNHVQLQVLEQHAQITILVYDIYGREHSRVENVVNQNYIIELPIPSGIYLINVRIGNKIYTQKVLKEN